MMYRLTFEDGSQAYLRSNIDYDRHTSMSMLHQLQTLSDVKFHNRKKVKSFAIDLGPLG